MRGGLAYALCMAGLLGTAVVIAVAQGSRDALIAENHAVEWMSAGAHLTGVVIGAAVLARAPGGSPCTG